MASQHKDTKNKLQLIGREPELNLISTMLTAQKNVLLEGPVGVGKTTLALAAIAKQKAKVVRVDGDGRFTEQKLVGSFDPKLVLKRGFNQQSFIPGPLYQAMKEGAVLLMNELNRMPEMVQNVLLPALDECKIQIPILGELKAKAGFCVIATQNPREFVATSPLSEALLDRLEWISITYLSEAEEQKIVSDQLGPAKNSTASAEKISAAIVKAVALTRLTRELPKIKRGASIRAAISIAQILTESGDFSESNFWRVAKSVLANRIELQVGKFSSQSYSVLLDEVIETLQVELKKKSTLVV
jgi:gas vesicle protein GvpN